MSKCRNCGADLMWVRTKAGRNMPCNTEKVFFIKGGPETFVTEKGDIVTGTRTAIRVAPAVIGHVPHYTTCPGALQNRE